jgi:hypothetical protein
LSFVFRDLKAGWAVAVLLACGIAAGATMAEPAIRTPKPEKPNLNNFLAESRARNAKGAAETAPAANLPAPPAPDQPAKPLSQADSEAVDQIIAMMSGAASSLDNGDGVTRGLSLGASLPAVPSMADLDHATAQAVVAAFTRPNSQIAEQQAQNAAAATVNPEFEERVALIRTLYRVDGTDSLVRHFIATVHMKLIITEVNNHVEIAHLSDPDKYRLSAIAAAAETELEEKVLNMNARQQAANMTKTEIMQLITAYDSDAQRKLTGQRLTDSGKLDRALDLEVRIAQYQIVKQFEAE